MFTISSSSSSSLLLLLAIVSLFFLLSPAALGSDRDHLAVVIRSSQSGGGAGHGVCAGVSVPHSCPINCFRADPVCGVDGVTYWCGCPDAACHGADVAKLGPCEVGNGGPGQALLLVHIVWLFLLAFAVLLGVF